jgi:tRNA(Ile)-lysidine synthase
MIDINKLSKAIGSDESIIGVSGGADSMFLLSMIASNRDKFACNFKVLHVNHQINSESSKWATLVSDYCAKINMSCEVVNIDVSKWGNNTEQAARRGRYDAFSKQPAKNIILGHHADDQVETFFLKIFRGSGPKGLRCMSYDSPCWFDTSKKVIRPLLDMTKIQLEEYVIEHDIPFVVDPSNTDTSYDRNWIRNCLLPFILDRIAIADINIRKVAYIQDEAYSLMTDLAKIDFVNIKLSENELDWRKLKMLSLSRVKNLIMHICTEHNLVDVSIHHVEAFSKGLLAANEDSRNELRLSNFRMHKCGKKIIID